MKIILDYSNINYIIFILKDMWIGILHHVANEHEWVLEEGVNGGQCAHAPLTEAERNKPWLKKDSAAHSALAKIVLDKRFQNTIPYFINFMYSAAQPYKLYNCIQYILIECFFFSIQTHRVFGIFPQPHSYVCCEAPVLHVSIYRHMLSCY